MRREMVCICEFDEYNWPIRMGPGCPVHDRPKTLSERWHTWLGRWWNR